MNEKMEKRIDVNSVLSTVDTAIDKLEENFQPSLLSQKELINVDNELKNVIRLGLKVKLQYQQRKIEILIKSLDENQEVDLVQLQLISNELDRVLKINKAA